MKIGARRRRNTCDMGPMRATSDQIRFRYFAQAMERLVGPDFEAGLKNLKATAERT